MKRQLMAYAAIAAFTLPILAPISALAQERGDRGSDDRAQAPQRDRGRPGNAGGSPPAQALRAERSEQRSEPARERPQQRSDDGGQRPDRSSDRSSSRGGGQTRDERTQARATSLNIGEARAPDQGRPNRPDAGQNRPDRPDSGRPDGGRPDSGRPDGGRPDGGRPDGGRPGAGRPDSGRPNGGRPDGGRPGAGRPDSGRPNGGRPDGGWSGGGRPDNNRPDRPNGGWNNNNQNRPDQGRPGGWNRDRDRDRQDYRNRFDSQRWQRDWNRSRGYDWWRNDRRFRGWSGVRIGFYFAPGYGYYNVPRQYYGQRYQIGQYLPEVFWRYRMDDYRTYGLGYPPEGTRWVYVDNSVYLIDDYDGYIIDIVRDFWRW